MPKLPNISGEKLLGAAAYIAGMSEFHRHLLTTQQRARYDGKAIPDFEVIIGEGGWVAAETAITAAWDHVTSLPISLHESDLPSPKMPVISNRLQNLTGVISDINQELRSTGNIVYNIEFLLGRFRQEKEKSPFERFIRDLKALIDITPGSREIASGSIEDTRLGNMIWAMVDSFYLPKEATGLVWTRSTFADTAPTVTTFDNITMTSQDESALWIELNDLPPSTNAESAYNSGPRSSRGLPKGHLMTDPQNDSR